MGQQTSKQHLPLTFGYVANGQHQQGHDEDGDVASLPGGGLADHVLAHPEQYRLEITCQCKLEMDRAGSEYVVATQKQTCATCRQYKRMSLVRHDLARDLAYIDETYYDASSSSSLSSSQALSLTSQLHHDDDHAHDDDDDVDIRAHWSKITVQEVTTSAQQRLPNPNQLATADNQHQGNPAPAFRGGLGSRLAAVHQSSLILDLSNRRLVKLNTSIGYLAHLTKLNLSNNQLTRLPKSIGYLNNLTVFNASNNQLTRLPLTMMHMTKLKAMNVSHNQLTQLPPSLGLLPDLMIIIANNNALTMVPSSLVYLRQLISLNVSHNPLTSLPAEIATIKSLRKLITEGCHFVDEFQAPMHHDPPSLQELCARQIVSSPLYTQHMPMARAPDASDVPHDGPTESMPLENAPLPSSSSRALARALYRLPEHLQAYLMTAQACSFCHGPYFESYVSRGRFIERHANQPVALEYRLCCAHWVDDQDRLLTMFSTPASVATPAMLHAKHANDANDATGNASTASHSQDMSPTPSQRYTRKRAASDLSFHASLPPLPTLHVPSSTSPSSTSSHSSTSSASTPTSTDEISSLGASQPQPTTSTSSNMTRRLAHLLSPGSHRAQSSPTLRRKASAHLYQQSHDDAASLAGSTHQQLNHDRSPLSMTAY
ncbi:hypothetical protein BC940DRAFT_371945 [Gongronella butleri]|nr:hypothetical protein BC940DRAFT_371945 [Gongronella butleri]